MGKSRFFHSLSFGNTHREPNSILHIKHVVNLGIVGRRRWAIESHFLAVHWMYFLISLTVPCLTYDATFLYSLACCATTTSLCNAPVRARGNVSHLSRPRQVDPTDRQTVVCVVADVDNHKKKIACFMSRFNLSRLPHRYSFQRPTFSDLVLTTTANLQQTCPKEHFRISDQSQLTDLQSKQHKLTRKL
jgi:hypothetical protein